ncbi:MAG: 3-dehydroquinate dehydratase [Bacteriovoracaceae bacterium]|jgi:3-dehydroquinate dehydratase-2|nr:3-dehydroquinate dehydratase [Bacteriovoracaceae bacterium]
MKNFLIINGPNLNLLGTREPEIYGALTLEEIKKQTTTKIQAEHKDVQLDWYQSNVEGDLINRVQQSLNQNYHAIVINPGGYSHTSVALLDALKMVKCPIIEVHLSNTHRREEFRSVKLTAKASTIIMEGLGIDAYYLAIKSQLL